MPTCGDSGNLTKKGTPCGFVVSGDVRYCPHHDPDQTRAQAFRAKGGLITNMKQLPDWIETGDFETTGDIRRTLAGIAREVASNQKADLKRAQVLIATCTAANTVLQTEAVRELNDTVMRAEGHGPALVILEGLKAGRTRRLPGLAERKAKVEEAEEA